MSTNGTEPQKAPSSAEIEAEIVGNWELVKQQKRILIKVLDRMESGAEKFSASLFKECGAQLKTINILMELTLQKSKIAEANDPTREPEVSPEDQALMDEWEDTLDEDGNPIIKYDTGEVEHPHTDEPYDSISMRTRYPNNYGTGGK